jgi:uncharacterized repeat protein (TIGR01451 family)
MKKILFYVLLLTGFVSVAQNDVATCAGAYSLCNNLGYPFANVINNSPAEEGNDYGCLYSQPNPVWFYLPVSQSGELIFTIDQYNAAGTPIDVDFICYGPFDTPTGGCTEQLTAENIIDCSYSASPFEEVNIPNALAGEYYLIMVTNFSNQPGNITIYNGASTGLIDCSGLNMSAFLDNNANGIQDEGEGPVPFGSFVVEKNDNGNPNTFSSPTANVTIYDESPDSSYDFQYTLPAQYTAYYSINPGSYTDIAPAPDGQIQNYSFAVSALQPYNDLAVYLISNQPPVPGFTFTQTIVYINIGNTTIASGTVNFTTTSGVSIISVSNPLAVITGNSFELPFTSLAPFESYEVTVELQTPVIPDINLGDLVTSTVTISPVTDDIVADNNTSESVQEVIGSYDPNDKMESRGRVIIIDDFDTNDYLYYTIRFQNEGTANAVNVRIEDVLDAQLDASSVEMLHSSHDFVLEKQGNTLTWKFNHIELPPAEQDEAGSQGYVYFRVKPAEGFGVGTIIPNTASIYFDFNPAIITNTFETEFMAALANEEFSINSVMIYPNPATDVVNVTNTQGLVDRLVIYDVSGKQLLNAAVEGDRFSVSTAELAPGSYLLTLSGEASKITKKLIVK